MKYVTTIERMAEERGEQRGEERGEGRGAKKIALNLLRKNMDIETIAEVTGLTIAQIEELQTQAN